LIYDLRQLNGVYTKSYNRKHDRAGHVYQGRYKAILVEKQTILLEAARYIVLNPVRAQMVRSARDWPWSSYRATAGQASAPASLHTDWLLAAFGKKKTAGHRRLQIIHIGMQRPASGNH
jgi:putative transposase